MRKTVPLVIAVLLFLLAACGEAAAPAGTSAPTAPSASDASAAAETESVPETEPAPETEPLPETEAETEPVPETEPQTEPAPATEPETGSASETAEAPVELTGRIIEPLEPFVHAGEPLADGYYFCSFSGSDLRQTESGWVLAASIYDYERYDPEEIQSLQVGDQIRHLGALETVTSLEYRDVQRDLPLCRISPDSYTDGYLCQNMDSAECRYDWPVPDGEPLLYKYGYYEDGSDMNLAGVWELPLSPDCVLENRFGEIWGDEIEIYDQDQMTKILKAVVYPEYSMDGDGYLIYLGHERFTRIYVKDGEIRTFILVFRS